VVIGLVSLLASGPVSAAPASVAINTLTPELKPAKSGSGSKIELSFTNLTDGPAVLEPEGTDCEPKLSANQLPPNQITAVTVEFAETCAKEGLKLKLDAVLAQGASQTFEIETKGAPAKAPNWKELWVFLVALLVSLALILPFFYCGWKPKNGAKRKLNQPLGSLDATWKFNDNWATNATGAGALLTGLFSATTAKAFLGENAEALTALATVGAGIALILVSAAPIATLATKSYKESKGKRGDAFTVGGILLGAGLVLAAAAGQLWVVAYTAYKLNLGSAGRLVWVGFGIAIVILGTYSFRSLRDLLERGTEEKAAEPDAEIEAAKLIVQAIEAAHKSGSAQGASFAQLGRTIEEQEAAADERYRRRARSALL
jgi:heme/copper-type cytochrome/quinol oxidase subunit 2